MRELTPNSGDGAHDETVRRAALPEVLFIPDLSLALGGVSDATARRLVLHGECGPFVRIGRRIAVRRASFLAALANREQEPSPTDERDGAGEVE